MDIIFSQDVHDEQKFLDCAEKLKYNEFWAKMFVLYNKRSDGDVFELMPDDRLTQLLYGWGVCHLPIRDSESLKDPELCHMVRVLLYHSLLMCLNKAVPAFRQIGDLPNINWSYVLQLQTQPWSLPYLEQLFLNLNLNKQDAIEYTVQEASEEDVAFLMQEGVSLALLRLVQLFNAGNFEAVNQLALRMLGAWLKIHHNAPLVSFEGDENTITLIGHLYLLAAFVRDDKQGYVIDHLMTDIRFYVQISAGLSIPSGISYTPSRLIAEVCVRLRFEKNGFFEKIGFRKFKLSLATSFAVILDAYSSYVLGNLLMDLQALNEHDFLEHLPQYKKLMNRYVEERESSERFLLNELKKMEQQRNSSTKPHVVDLNLNYQQHIGKGNRASNINNYNWDDDEEIQPQVPNNEEVLSYVYKLLAERDFSGWRFAKIALLLKIIGQQINALEIWRYHSGLTVDFMLDLEQKMSASYADLAKLFSDHGFMEAEFWLTAFYLHPTSSNYNEVKRCSWAMKNRQEEGGLPAPAPSNVKYELLSSTIDVHQIMTITNHEDPVSDYDNINKSLKALRLPSHMTKDLLNVVFQPRNKQYSWALDWHTLHERCDALLKSQELKRKFVSLYMAESCDDLKYLQIDYAKYRNRPQLDYGTIEEGYENATNLSNEEGEAEPTQAVDDKAEKAKEQKKRHAQRKFWYEVSEDEEEAASSDSEPCYSGNGRRTGMRAAAIAAKAKLFKMRETSNKHFVAKTVVKKQPKITVQPKKQKTEMFSEDEEEAASSASKPCYTGNGRRTGIRAAAIAAKAKLSAMSSSETSKKHFVTQPVVKEQTKVAVQPKKLKSVMFSEGEDKSSSTDTEHYYTRNGRLNRIRAAATATKANLPEMDRQVRGGRRSISLETSDKHSDTQPVVEEGPKIAVQPQNQRKRTFAELIESRPKFTNVTEGFKPIPDIWNFNKEELQNVVSGPNDMVECSSIMDKMKLLKNLKMSKSAKAAGQPCPQLVRTGSETESVNSETSTMATHDFNVEGTSVSSSGEGKEQTPSPTANSDLSTDPEVLKPTNETEAQMINGALKTTNVPQKTLDLQFLSKKPIKTV
ncbi:GM13392 [Drosophila sechellia]|uniref:GM13392 n=1 Tax=Drosophila sechellia TaxID=7238 RepID=B4IF91_DROSE|nr:GM13392 [Drosophila sechellia]